MAGTGVADATGYDATYTNPAGLVGPTERRLTLGYVHAGYRLNLDGAHHPVDATDGLVLGADLPMPFGGVLRDRVALGLGFYFPFGVINRARAPFPDEPRLALLDYAHPGGVGAGRRRRARARAGRRRRRRAGAGGAGGHHLDRAISAGASPPSPRSS